MALTTEDVVVAAVDLLDRRGLEGLTLRNLADDLGVSAPTLYWHIDDKRHLLDLMVGEIYGRADVAPTPAPGQRWWNWLASNARAQRDILISIRDAALVVAGNRPTEGALPFIETMIQSLVATGMPAHTALKALRSLNDYVVGSAIEYQAMVSRTTNPRRDTAIAHEIRSGDSYPLLRAALGSPDESLETIFEAGLEWFIAGLRANVAEGMAMAARD